MGELIAGILLAGGAVVFVLRPVFQPSAAAAAGEADDGPDPEDDLSPRAVALRALKEIEFDRATGKLSDADYDALKARYTAEALVALRAEAEAPATPPGPHLRASAAAAPGRGPAHPAACPTHGPRPERDAAFCSECGRRLTAAPGYCIRCGTSLEQDARYCQACGARVAA
ncbi:MAG TPA: zinc ribbon domain-containing protein [Gemmatimonadales bacterium]|nr:zinc ribbon domain-containing protein [Gemmatimonadales bacterium]